MAYKPIDSRRDNFRKYVEEAGLTEMISKTLASLCAMTDWPDDPIDHFRNHIGSSLKEKAKIDSLNQKIDKCNLRIEELERQLEEAKAIKCEPIDDSIKLTTANTVNDTPIKTEAEIKVEPPEPEEDDSNTENLEATENIIDSGSGADADEELPPSQNEADFKSADSSVDAVASEPIIEEAKPDVDDANSSTDK